jgi:hypothetical protein
VLCAGSVLQLASKAWTRRHIEIVRSCRKLASITFSRLSLLSKNDKHWFLNCGKTSCYTHHTFLLGFPTGWLFTTHKDNLSHVYWASPLPPWMPLEQHRSFLQACKPLKRIFCTKTVSSCCVTPSGFVPGGGAVGRLYCLSRRRGAGARRQGPDGISVSLSRILSTKCKGPWCNLHFFKGLLVKYTPPTE